MVFDNAHNFSMGKATINVFQNAHTPLPADPSEILRLARAPEASHTSSTASYASKCHPATREQVIADIVDWVAGDAGVNQDTVTAPRASILWFSGPAGGGKTCIMRNVVDHCEATGLSVLSYFFSTRGSGLTSERPFVATIVYQLTILHPALRPMILNTIQGHPAIFEESLDFQMDRLLVQPLQSPAFWSQSPPPHKIVIAIDGFDECGEDREREHLLNILRSLVTKLPRSIVVIIASRPEFDLRRAFDHPKLSNITKILKLQEYDGSEDVWIFLCDEFEVIRQTHFLKKSIPEGWPLEEIVQLLVDKSSGNFIFPATAIKYIKTSRQNPVDSLNNILGLLKNAPPDTSNPLAELDALYSLILHPPNTNLPLMKRILHCILGVTALGEGNYLLPSFVDEFFGLPPDTTTTTLCDLHSILSITDDEPIKFHHKSLEDYLLNPQRSLDLFQSLYETHVDLIAVCAMHLTRWRSNPVVDQPVTLRYSSRQWSNHLQHCIDHNPISATLPDTITNMDPRTILKHRFVQDLPFPGYTRDFREAVHAALCSSEKCSYLCQLLARMDDCQERFEAFRATFAPTDFEKRLEALSRFESETGLYELLDPDGDTALDDNDKAPEAGISMTDGQTPAHSNHIEKTSRIHRFPRRLKRWFGGSRSPS